ncbi:hypothetical protein C0Q70_04163 [Pomacea canaliculata]|uniref:Uncharacterized protein n=1 Tax=Pomacea canaliculata TaxID=400727 RepID=A0A2T7PUS6_POMCA|nr:hypothetical protein C0Q70_04163 [Pomacea canaliculata]
MAIKTSFVHHSVIHKAGFRSLGKGEVVEFEPRLSYKGIEATFVCGIGGVKCRGSDRRPMSKKKFQNKPVVQLQQRQPQRRQSQAELQRDRFHGRSGRSTCNISSRPVDDSVVYTVRPLVDGPALTLNTDNRAAKSSLQLEDIQLPETQNCQDYDSDEETPFWYGTLPPHQARTRLIPKVTVPVVPEVTVPVVPEVTVDYLADASGRTPRRSMGRPPTGGTSQNIHCPLVAQIVQALCLLLKRQPMLQEADFYFCQFTHNEGLQVLKALTGDLRLMTRPNLINLNLEAFFQARTHYISLRTFTEVMGRFTSLAFLRVDQHYLCEAVLDKLITGCAQTLRHLDIVMDTTVVHAIDSHTWSLAVQRYPSLTVSVRLYDVYTLEEYSRVLVESMPLTRVSFWDMSWMRDITFADVARFLGYVSDIFFNTIGEETLSFPSSLYLRGSGKMKRLEVTVVDEDMSPEYIEERWPRLCALSFDDLLFDDF